MNKLKPIIEGGIYWNKVAGDMARDFCPPIYACKKCSYPVIEGYCCEFCGDSNPSSTDED